ncbi:TAP-like protein-domain-containing protein [Zopfochytrium polystomum]|nr:TAP-like protein-domain-containing protein [Zopfochytrium polystomum]
MDLKVSTSVTTSTTTAGGRDAVRHLVLPAAAAASAAGLRARRIAGTLALAIVAASLLVLLQGGGFGGPTPAPAATTNVPATDNTNSATAASSASNPILDWLRKRFPGWFPPRNPEPSPKPDPFGWKKCNDVFFCGSIPVPLDHLNASDSRRISIAVVKFPAQAKPRLGTIFINPGGPGGSGAGFAKRAAPLISLLTGGHHDILGFDPRGIGASNSVICYPSASAHAAADIAAQTYSVPGFHDSPISFPAFGALSQSAAAACQTHSPSLLPYISTAYTNRDMDLMRAALGEDKLNYWGFSYGTFLGISYVNLFPDRVGAVILDGVTDPTTYTGTSDAWTRTSLTDTEGVLDGLGRECEAAAAAATAGAASRGCALAKLVSPSRPTVAALLRGAQDDLDAAPVALSTGSVVPFLSGLHAADAIFSALYSPAKWPLLADAFHALLDPSQRDAVPLARFLGAQAEDDVGAYCPATDDSGSNGFLAVKCADGVRDSTDLAQWEEEAKRAETEYSPLYGRPWSLVTRPCAFWPRPVERFAGPWNNTLSNKVLLIGNTLDPVTPLASAQVAASLMTDANSVLLTQRAYGHCSIAQVSSCTVKAVQDYFVRGALPEPGTVCEADRAPFDAPDEAVGVLSSEVRAQVEEVAALVAKANRVWK